MIIWHKVNITIYNLYIEYFLFTVRKFSISEENAHLAQGMFLAKCRSVCPNVLKNRHLSYAGNSGSKCASDFILAVEKQFALKYKGQILVVSALVENFLGL